MYVRAYLHIHIHMHIYIYIDTHGHIHRCISVCIYIYACGYLYIYIHTYAYVHAYMVLCKYVDIYIYTHVYTYIHIAKMTDDRLALLSRVTEEPLAHVCISSPRGFLCGTAYTLCTISASNHFEEVCRHQMPKHRAKAFRPACCLDLVERKVNVCVPWLHRLLGLRTLGLRAQRYGLKFPAARAEPVLERGNSEAVYGNKSR